MSENSHSPAEIVNICQAVIDHHEKFKNCYFWSPPTSASQRRHMEARDSQAFEIEYCGDSYQFDQTVRCSCKSVYYSATFRRGGKDKDIRTVKALLRDAKAAL